MSNRIVIFNCVIVKRDKIDLSKASVPTKRGWLDWSSALKQTDKIILDVCCFDLFSTSSLFSHSSSYRSRAPRSMFDEFNVNGGSTVQKPRPLHTTESQTLF